MARETVLIDHVKRLEIEEERLPIFEALILLEEVNKQTILNKSIGSCRIRIYNHKKSPSSFNGITISVKGCHRRNNQWAI